MFGCISLDSYNLFCFQALLLISAKPTQAIPETVRLWQNRRPQKYILSAWVMALSWWPSAMYLWEKNSSQAKQSACLLCLSKEQKKIEVLGPTISLTKKKRYQRQWLQKFQGHRILSSYLRFLYLLPQFSVPWGKGLSLKMQRCRNHQEMDSLRALSYLRKTCLRTQRRNPRQKLERKKGNFLNPHVTKFRKINKIIIVFWCNPPFLFSFDLFLWRCMKQTIVTPYLLEKNIIR